MESQQEQLYRFYRGDTSIYKRNRFNGYIDKSGGPRSGIYFNMSNPEYYKCDKYCEMCSRYPENNLIDHCKRCQECLKPAQEIIYKHLPKKVYPQFPKEQPLIPFPFSFELPHISPHLKNVGSKLSSTALSTSNLACLDYCEPQVCNDYNRQLILFEQCKLTQNNEDCRRQYGCKQWEGRRFRYTAPLPPHLTDCEACWKQNYTNI